MAVGDKIRIYGPNQEAGVEVSTPEGKGNIKGDGLTAYAKAVVVFNADGTPATSFGLSTEATVAAPTHLEGALGEPLSLDLAGNLRVIDPTAIAVQEDMLTALQTPAASLPPQVPVESSSTTLTRVTVSISSATTTSIVSATASQSTRVHRIVLTVGGTQTLTFQSASTSLGAFDFPSTGGILVLDFSEYWWFKTANNEAFQITTSGAAAVKGIIDYVKGA